jgi:hypothetical protein
LLSGREVLGPHVNPPWLNVLATAITGALLALSALLTATIIAPHLPLAPTVTGLAAAITVVAVCAAVTVMRSRKARAPPGTADRLTWTMPPIESLRPATHSAWRTLGLVVLRCYLLAAVIVLAVRALQIALGIGWRVTSNGRRARACLKTVTRCRRDQIAAGFTPVVSAR